MSNQVLGNACDPRELSILAVLRKIQPMPKLGPWVEELERQLEANEKKARRDRLSLLRIHEDLASLGYEGGYDAVRRYARAWRRRWRLLSPSQAFVPLSFDPGEAYQFDWSHEYARLSGVTTRVKAAHMRLCYSRMQLVQIFPRESQEMVFEAHERAFRFFVGVYLRIPTKAATDSNPKRPLWPGVEIGVVIVAVGCSLDVIFVRRGQRRWR